MSAVPEDGEPEERSAAAAGGAGVGLGIVSAVPEDREPDTADEATRRRLLCGDVVDLVEAGVLVGGDVVDLVLRSWRGRTLTRSR